MSDYVFVILVVIMGAIISLFIGWIVITAINTPDCYVLDMPHDAEFVAVNNRFIIVDVDGQLFGLKLNDIAKECEISV